MCSRPFFSYCRFFLFQYCVCGCWVFVTIILLFSPFLLSVVVRRFLLLIFADDLVTDGSNGNYFGYPPVGAMRIEGDQLSRYDRRFNMYRDTAVGAGIKCWHHCACRDESWLWCRHASMHSPFVRCYEEVDYERRRSPIIFAHRAAEGGSFKTSLPEVVRFSCP